MAKMKKIVGIVLALAMVFTISVSAMSASAASDASAGFKLFGRDVSLSRLLDPFNIFGSRNDNADNDAVIADDATDTTTKREPLINFYFDYDVVRTLSWGIRIGHVPETTTEPVEEPTVPEETTEEVTEAPVEITTQAPLADAPVEITEKTPQADVEQVANTGDAGVAVVVALSAVSAAAFVVAKKK